MARVNSEKPMSKNSAGVVPTARRIALLAAWLAALLPGLAADPANPPAAEPYDYAEPKLLTGTLYEIGSQRKIILYTFRRTAIRSGSTVDVQRQFFGTNGSVAAEEHAVYESGQLVNFQMKEHQAGISGAVVMTPHPKRHDRQQIIISFSRGPEPPQGEPENLQPDTLVDDTLYPFMLGHWDELLRGESVKFRFVSIERRTTFNFRLVNVGTAVADGRPVVLIKMEPTNPFVATFVDSLLFTVEQDGARRILSYTGRTTPRVKKGKSWKYLDAETVFDWK